MADQVQTPTILRRKQVQARTGLSSATLYRRMAVGDFPLPVDLGGNSVGWYESEVTDWLLARSKSRKGARLTPPLPTSQNDKLPV